MVLRTDLYNEIHTLLRMKGEALQTGICRDMTPTYFRFGSPSRGSCQRVTANVKIIMNCDENHEAD